MLSQAREDNVHMVLVDDVPLVNRIHEALIGRVNAAVKLASFISAPIALEYVHKQLPKLILLDINMGEMDAWTFLGNLEDRRVDANVVIVSSSINPIDRHKAFTFPAVKRFLVKPLTKEAIAELLEEYV